MVDEECRKLQNFLKDLNLLDRFEVFPPRHGISMNELQNVLLVHRPDVVHCSGRGSIVGALVIENRQGDAEKVSSEAFSDLFRVINHSDSNKREEEKIRCVILNACYSEKRQAKAIAKYVDCVIEISNEIPEPSATIFEQTFYRSLAEEMSVQEAYDSGKNKLKLKGKQTNHLDLVHRTTVFPDEVFLVKNPQKTIQDNLFTDLDRGINAIRKLDPIQQDLKLQSEAELERNSFATFPETVSLNEKAQLTVNVKANLGQGSSKKDVIPKMQEKVPIIVHVRCNPADSFEFVNENHGEIFVATNIEIDSAPLQFTLEAKKIGKTIILIDFYQESVYLGTLEVATKIVESRVIEKSLESVLEYTFNNFDQNDRIRIPQLTIFKSPFSAAAVEYIFGSEMTAITLLLFKYGLLKKIEIGQFGDIDVKHRLYLFHPTVRNYLEHKVEEVSELEKQFGDRFAQYYVSLVKETYDAFGRKNGILSLQRFDIIAEGENNDFDGAIMRAKDRLLASSISSYLGLVLMERGLLTNSLGYFKKALQIHEELDDRVGIAGDYTNIGVVLNKMGDHKQALSYHKKALGIDERLGDKKARAQDFRDIGLVLRSMGDHKQALSYHEKALQIHEELDDRVGIAGDYTNIGVVLNKMGDHKQALSYHEKALQIHEELEDRVELAGDCRNAGLSYFYIGDRVKALGYFNKAEKILLDVEKRTGHKHPLIGQIRKFTAFIGEGE